MKFILYCFENKGVYKYLKNILKHIYNISILFLITLLFFFKEDVNYNEMDVIPYAKALYNSSWLITDWYLHLKIPYRFLFSYPVGFLTDSFGFYNTIFFGRLTTYLLFSITIYQLIKTISIAKFYIVSLIPFLAYALFFNDGIGAGEWIIGGLDTKVFSYISVLLSLTYLLKKNLKWCFIFAALALSFHILIGFYNSYCLFVLLVFEYLNKRVELKKITQNIPFFLIFGTVGFYGIFQQLTTADFSVLGWETYVNFRVKYHVLPNHFLIEYWIKFFIFSLLSLWFFIKTKSNYTRLTTLYTLSSTSISIIGLFVFMCFPNHYMKYYFFRFSDAILPLFTLINIILFTIEKKKTFFESNKNKVIYGSLAIIIALTIPKISDYFSKEKYSVLKFKNNSSKDIKMMNWVKQNTSKDAVFIVPQENNMFYINYKRPAFVSYKHSPQQNNHLIEWRNRLQLLNKGNELTTKEMLFKNYHFLSEEDLFKIKKKYQKVTYILTTKETQLNFPLVYTTEYQNLYQL